MRAAAMAAACAIVCAAAPAAADTSRAQRRAITAGPVVALHVASMSGDATLAAGDVTLDAAPRGRDRFGIGGFAALRLTDMFDLRVEVLYSQRGSRNGGSGPAGEASYEIRYSVDGIAVPILAAYHIPYDGDFSPRVLAGAELMFPLDSKLDADATFEDLTFDETTDMKDDTTSVDLALVVGGGMGFPVAGRHVVIDLRYALGLTSTVDEHTLSPIPTTTYESSSLRSQTFSVSASFEL